MGYRSQQQKFILLTTTKKVFIRKKKKKRKQFSRSFVFVLILIRNYSTDFSTTQTQIKN